VRLAGDRVDLPVAEPVLLVGDGGTLENIDAVGNMTTVGMATAPPVRLPAAAAKRLPEIDVPPKNWAISK